MWLYKLTNKLTGKEYIGPSVNPVSQRVSRHAYAARNSKGNMPITCAIKKYGIENFSVQTLVRCPDYEYLLDLEAKAIVRFNTRVPVGYNVTAGGRGGRVPCSQEKRERISAATQGRIPWNYGKRNPETERRYAQAGKGRYTPPKGVPSWNAGMKFGPLPEETKKKLSESLKRVRAARFWSSRKKESNLAGEGV